MRVGAFGCDLRVAALAWRLADERCADRLDWDVKAVNGLFEAAARRVAATDHEVDATEIELQRLLAKQSAKLARRPPPAAHLHRACIERFAASLAASRARRQEGSGAEVALVLVRDTLQAKARGDVCAGASRARKCIDTAAPHASAMDPWFPAPRPSAPRPFDVLSLLSHR